MRNYKLQTASFFRSVLYWAIWPCPLDSHTVSIWTFAFTVKVTFRTYFSGFCLLRAFSQQSLSARLR